MVMNPFANLKTIDDFRRADEEFQIKKQQVAAQTEYLKQHAANLQKGGDKPALMKIAEAYQQGTPETRSAMEMFGKVFDKGMLSGGVNMLGGQAPVDNWQNPDMAASPAPMMIQPINGYADAKAGIEKTVAGAKEQGQKDVDLTMNPKIGGATKTAEINAGQVGELQKKADSANSTMKLTQQARDLLNSGNATGSYLGAGRDFGKKLFGVSDIGTQTNSKLDVIAGNLTSNVPRMEGPQSDADRAYYQAMAGRANDKTLPDKDRLAALDAIDQLSQKYEGINTPQKTILNESISTMPTNEIPADVQANMGNIRVTPQTDHQQKEAAFNARKNANEVIDASEYFK